MPSTKQKLQVLAASITLLLLAAGVGCTGFFVNPTLTTITVSPTTPSIQENATLQMIATGSYDDGSTKTITGSVSWSTSDDTIATVNSSGVVKGVAPGSASITATSAAISGSTTVNISFANLVSITISPSSQSVTAGDTVQYSATGHFSSGPDQVITSAVTWASSNSSVATIDSTGLASTLTAGTTTITASSGSITSNSSTLTVQ
jgi:uncharacterized protein YjdB